MFKVLCMQELAQLISKEQDEKLSAAVNQLKRMIQQVANAPVQVNLGDEAKREIVRELETRVAAIEKRI
jgi:hypothetical protein